MGSSHIISADPACSRGSASEEELPAARAKKSLQAARARSKKEEARSKKQLQATSGKKQETRSQEATSGWKTGQRASFLVDSESNVRQAAGRQLRELVFLQVEKATLGSGGRGPQARSVPQGLAAGAVLGQTAIIFLDTGGRGPQARSVPQGPAVLVWRRRCL